MRLFFKTMEGKTIELDFAMDGEGGGGVRAGGDPTRIGDYQGATVEELKQKIFEKYEGFPVDRQRLIFAGKVLEDGRCVHEYGVQKDTTMHLILRDAPAEADPAGK